MKRLLMIVSAVLLLPACSDAKGGGSSTADRLSLVGLLRSVPDTPDDRGQPVYYGNLSRLRGSEHPSSSNDDVSLLMDRSSSAVFLPNAIHTSIFKPEFVEFAGFDTRAIDASLEFGVLPDSVASILEPRSTSYFAVTTSCSSDVVRHAGGQPVPPTR